MSEERRLAAIMFTDMVGYTALMGRDEARARQLVEYARSLLKSFVEKYHGQWLEEIGDGTLSAFPSAVEAVDCALAIQDSFEADPDLTLRIGVHLGDVVFAENQIYGDGVNVASRIESLARPGSVVISEPVHSALRGHSRIRSNDLGRKKLKNVDQPVQVYEVEERTLASSSASGAGNSLSKTVAPRTAAFSGFAVLLVIAALLTWMVLPGMPGMNTKASGSTIAVLPFEALGQNDSSVLIEGLHDDLLTRLSNIAGLTVISNSSVQQYRNSNKVVSEIADELGVKWVIEGSVQEIEDEIQVNVQLVDPETNTQAWANRYRRDLTAENLFDLQGEITKTIADALKTQLSPAEAQRVTRRPTENLEAYRLYMQGWRLYEQREPAAPDRVRRAADYFLQALEIDPKYARAWAGLADATISLVGQDDDIQLPASVSSPEESARRALKLDPELAEAHAALGYSQQIKDNSSAALQSLKRAVQLRPSYAYAQFRLGLLFVHNLGRPEPAVEHLERAVKLNPAAWFYREWLATAYLANGQVDKAHQEARRLRRQHAQANPPWTLIRVLCHLGRFEEARKIVEEYLPHIEYRAELFTNRSFINSWHMLHAMTTARAGDEDRARELLADLEAREVSFAKLGMVHAALGETEAAFQAFDRADDSELPTKALRYFFPHILASVREDPRYDELLRRINRAEGLNPDGSLPDEES